MSRTPLPYPTLPYPTMACGCLLLRATGTNNQELLKSPFYVGVKHQRVRGDAYYELIDELMSAVKRRHAISTTDCKFFRLMLSACLTGMSAHARLCV